MLPVPDPARRADGQGGFVDLTCGTVAFASLGFAGSTGSLSGLVRSLAPVRMADLSIRFSSVARFLDGFRLDLISLLLLVQLLELALVAVVSARKVPVRILMPVS